ncbi:MAG: hypothetical protein FWC95_01130 [Defluviitaleaceae bacterium]|nr:hypothetical protein [Defluviitaleaceae bacterium]
MMKRPYRNILCIAIIALLFLTGSNALQATGAVPGSSGDPIVTQSFVLEQLAALRSELVMLVSTNLGQGGQQQFNLTDTQRAQIVSDVVQIIQQQLQQQPPQPQMAQTWQPVQLFWGQRLIGGEGAEIIVRSGVANAIVPGANGLSDVTAGVDIMSGQIPVNHMIIIPRSDGRGIVAQGEVWVLVRGPHLIH